MQDWPEVDAVVVPIGGGGLISGVSMAVKAHNPRTRVIGVESSDGPAMPLHTPILFVRAGSCSGFERFDFSIGTSF